MTLNVGKVRTGVVAPIKNISMSAEEDIIASLKYRISVILNVPSQYLGIHNDNISNARYILMNNRTFIDAIEMLVEASDSTEEIPIFYNDTLNIVDQIWVTNYTLIDDEYSRNDPSLAMRRIILDIFNILINYNISVITDFLGIINVSNLRTKIYERSTVYTGVMCKKCKDFTVVQKSIQLRSGDEGSSLQEVCTKCNFKSLKWN